jgi:phosphoribosylformylglycinamidine (FGAM) synthase-like amidotransferase family enzyme
MAIHRPETERGHKRLRGRAAVVVGGGPCAGDRPGTGSATARFPAVEGAPVAVAGHSAANTRHTVG